MTRKTILHIGLEKTGTTAIQEFLHSNSKTLKGSGILTPQSIRPRNNYWLAVSSYLSHRSDALTRALKLENQQQIIEFRTQLIAKLRQELAENTDCPNVIITSEQLQSHLKSLGEIGQLKTILNQAGLAEVRILLYVREPIRIAISHWGMAIKKGAHLEAEDFEPNHRRVQHILNFRKVIENWQQVFGAENILVRRYPEGAAPEVLIKDFLAATKVANPSLQYPPMDTSKTERSNRNLSGGSLRILNAFNGKSDLIKQLNSNRRLFSRLEATVPGSGFSPPEAVVASFEEYYRESNEWLRANFFSDQDSLWSKPYRPSAEGLDLEAASAPLADVLGLLEASLGLLQESDAKASVAPKSIGSKLRSRLKL